MIRQCFSRLPNISLLYPHNPLRAFVLGGLALMVLAFAGPALVANTAWLGHRRRGGQMISRATLSPCPAMARGWRLGRL